MSSLTKWITKDVPDEWADLLGRAAMVAVVAFVVLQVKEFFDARTFDTLGTAADAALIATGYLVLNAILKWAKS